METRDIIMAVIALLSTGGFLGTLRSLYLAKPDRQKAEAEREHLMAQVRATTIEQWHALADERQQEITSLRERLVAVEACLDETRTQLRAAQKQVAALEMERVQWQQERKGLMQRIEELEGRR
ncbi:MAG: hypothetical protein ABFE07_13435 [Armatimonadia bacterium]